MIMRNTSSGLGAPLSPELPLNETPVTWHVAFWLLATIAIGSMAQRTRGFCGLPRSCQLYLSSSPIICAAEGLTLIVGITTLCVRLGISPATAAYLQTRISRPDEHKERPAWPVWLFFFFLATLPSAIRLFSFSGVPGTQTLALMFLCSFIVNEAAALTARFSRIRSGPKNSSSLDEILSELSSEPSVRTLKYIRLFEITIFILAVASHLAFGLWAVMAIWYDVAIAIRNSAPAQDFGNGVMWISFLIFLSSWITNSILSRMGKGETNDRLGIQAIFSWSLKILLLFVVYFPRTLSTTNFSKVEGVYGCMWLWFGGHVFYKLLVLACKRWPAIGETLLIIKKPSSKDASTQTDKGEDKVADIENAEEAKDVGETKVVKDSPFEEKSDDCLFFFLTSLVVCVSWYTVKFDQTGTISPPWTDVLAKGLAFSSKS